MLGPKYEQLVDTGSKYEKEYKIIILPDSPIHTKRKNGYQMQHILWIENLVLAVTISQECKMQSFCHIKSTSRQGL